MADLFTYLEEGMKTVKALLKKGDLLSAVRGCQELLKVDPYNQTLLKLLSKIEKEILEKNEKMVKKEIDRTWHLWKEKRFEELLRIYRRLAEYAPQYQRLQELIQKAEQTLGEDAREKRETFIREALNAVEKISKDERWEEAMKACKELLFIDSQNEKAKGLLRRAREKIVEKKLKEREELVDSAEFEQQREFYNQLLAIDPDSEKVKGLLAETFGKLRGKQIVEAKILMNEGEKRIKTLFDQQEYEKVLQTAEEMKMLDAHNFIANLYEGKARAAIMEETEQNISKLIREAFENLRREYREHPEAFVRI